MFENVASVLKPGGHFITSVSNENAGSDVLGIDDFETTKVVYEMPMRYGSVRTKTTFMLRSDECTERLANKKGFELVEVRFMKLGVEYFRGCPIKDLPIGILSLITPTYKFQVWKYKGVA
ncbi:hypothetical protein JW796_00450 [Candidatus Dojkabacteria bacterium]|nr:hypothetical protein [Candidatus Dojkabacteria bacterium]